MAKQLLLDALDSYRFDGVDVSGEATGYYWLPFFLQQAADPDLERYDLNLFLLNPRWVHWFKSGHHLRDPLDNARKLQLVASESFSLPDAPTLPVQRILELTLDYIRFLEAQVAQVEDWITAELPSHPVIPQLTTIPGIGPVFSCGIGAEVDDVQRFLQDVKWDKRRKRHRPRNLRDAEDAVAKIAGLW